MPITRKTRKPVQKLQPADFTSFPIWEFASDEEGGEGQDETWVRPVDRAQVPPKAYSQLVGADFKTPRGRKLVGFMDVTTARSEIEIRPGSIVRRGLYQCLPTLSREQAVAERREWALRDREDLSRALGLTEAEVFPLTYVLRARIRGEKTYRSGIVA